MADNTVYWFVTFDCQAELPAKSSAEIKQDALALTQGWAHGIVECIENTPAETISRGRFFDRWALPGSELGTGSVTLVGDALHPMTPNLGQVCSAVGVYVCG